MVYTCVVRIGDRVTELLREKGWSQALLARRCGVTRAAISNICRGSDPSLPLLRRIATELSVSESDLLDGTDPAPRTDAPGDPPPTKVAASG